MISHEETQQCIEFFIMDEYKLHSNSSFILGGINTDTINTHLKKFILDNLDSLDTYTCKMKDYYQNNNKLDKTSQIFIRDVINKLSVDYLKDLCMSHFLLIYTHQNTDNDNYLNLTVLSVDLGNKITRKYFNLLRYEYSKENGPIGYS